MGCSVLGLSDSIPTELDYKDTKKLSDVIKANSYILENCYVKELANSKVSVSFKFSFVVNLVGTIKDVVIITNDNKASSSLRDCLIAGIYRFNMPRPINTSEEQKILQPYNFYPKGS